MYLSDIRVQEGRGAMMTGNVESDPVKDRTLRARFEIVSKVARIGGYILCATWWGGLVMLN